MVDLKNFELENAELIFGGDLIPSIWIGPVYSGADMYDTETGRILYREK